jgi:hypothetical protein
MASPFFSHIFDCRNADAFFGDHFLKMIKIIFGFGHARGPPGPRRGPQKNHAATFFGVFSEMTA